MSLPQPFQHPITVTPTDIDFLGHVNNVVYVRWIQEIAVAHWQVVAAPEDEAALLWVVLRHEIDYKRPALLQDELIGITGVGSASLLKFERHTEILRAADREVLVKARTLWCPVNRQTGKPTPVRAEVRTAFAELKPRR